MVYSVSQNTSFYTAASVLQKAVSFLYFTIVARAIGVENTGHYFFALSFAAIFTVVADFGLGPVLTREAAKYPDQSGKYLAVIFWTKMVFGLAAYGLAVAAVQLLGYSPTLKLLIYVAGITMFFDNLQTAFFSIFRARRNMVYESAGIVVSQITTLAVGLIALHRGWPLWSLIAAYTAASFVTLLYAAYHVRRAYGLSPAFRFDRSVFTSFMLLAVPFGVAGIITRLYSYADSILMSKLLDPVYLGWWSVPYKITFAFQFIPVAVAASIYPVMSSWTISDRSQIGVLFEKAWRYLLLVSSPLAFGLAAIAEPLIVWLYGESYLPSVPVLRILLASLVFGYLSFITAATLNATNNQKKQTVLLSATLAGNIILNVVLLPILAIKGAALAALAGNMFLCCGGYFLVRRQVALNGLALLSYAQRVVWPAAIMGGAVYLIVQKIPFWFTIPLGAVIYGLLVYLTRGVTRDMLLEFWGTIFAKKPIA